MCIRDRNLTTPPSVPWSVSATAGMPSSLALWTRLFTRQAPSSSEYSLWTWSWTKSEATEGSDSSTSTGRVIVQGGAAGEQPRDRALLDVSRQHFDDLRDHPDVRLIFDDDDNRLVL